jgi:hypothetical protein
MDFPALLAPGIRDSNKKTLRAGEAQDPEPYLAVQKKSKAKTSKNSCKLIGLQEGTWGYHAGALRP